MVDAFFTGPGIKRIKGILIFLCEVTNNLPLAGETGKPFLGNNAFIKGALGLIVHMLLMEGDGCSELKWATQGFYKDCVRASKYNEMTKYLLESDTLKEERIHLGRAKKSPVEVIDCFQLSNWCSNMKRKISKGVWCDNSDYTSSRIYGGHLEFIQKLGFQQSD